MANYATNLFYAETENRNDLEKVENFLEENFNDCCLQTDSCFVEAEFSSKWDFPEKEMDELVSSLEAKDEIYIRVLTHELCNEYVSFRIFSNGEWDIRY